MASPMRWKPSGNPLGIGSRTFLIVGADHKTAPDLLRERLQGDEADQLRLISRCREAGIDQATVLVTCDRCEIWAAVEDPAVSAPTMTALIAEAASLSPAEIAPQLHRLSDTAALRYAFAVAASLESQVIGEPQVLGQVKDAHRLSSRIGALGAELDAILQAALAAGKRVRSETDIAAQSVSMAACIIALCRQVFGDLGRVQALLLGDGEMGQFVAEQLMEAGLKRWTAGHHSKSRVEAWANRHRVHSADLANLSALLSQADLVITALDGSQITIGTDAVKAALKARRHQPMLFVDLAVPGDIDPKVNAIEDSFLYGLDDLERLAMKGRKEREQAATAAWRIVDEAVAGFEKQSEVRLAAPTLTALKARFDGEREQVLAENPGIDAAEATRRLINRLLHQPLAALRQAAPDPALEEAVRRLFGIDDKKN